MSERIKRVMQDIRDHCDSEDVVVAPGASPDVQADIENAGYQRVGLYTFRRPAAD